MTSKGLIKKLLREGLLIEDAIGKHLVVVDIQPEYSNYFGDLAHDLFEYINQNYDSFYGLTFLYNGDSLGMINESDYRFWLMENGLDEDIAYNVKLYDKAYAFFRYCMDNDIEEDNIVNLVRFMVNNNIHDSREIDEDFWNQFISEYGDEDIRELIEFSDDAIHIPDLIDELKSYNNIVLVGGGINECLKEVEIACKAIDKAYKTWDRFTY